jgi:hypothetical protein
MSHHQGVVELGVFEVQQPDGRGHAASIAKQPPASSSAGQRRAQQTICRRIFAVFPSMCARSVPKNAL